MKLIVILCIVIIGNISSLSFKTQTQALANSKTNQTEIEEMKKWTDLMSKFSSPIGRLEKYLTRRGLIDEAHTKALRKDALNQVRNALKNATNELLPEVDQLFE